MRCVRKTKKRSCEKAHLKKKERDYSSLSSYGPFFIAFQIYSLLTRKRPGIYYIPRDFF